MSSVRYRRGLMTTPSQSAVYNIQWQDNKTYDRSQADSELGGTPVKMTNAGSGSFEILGGAFPTDRYGQTMVITIEDIAVSGGSETATTRTFTFTDVTFNIGAKSAADSSRGGITVNFDYTACTQS